MTWDQATIICGGVATLAIFSFLVKENPFYRIFEHIFIGISAGLGTVLTIKSFIWPKVIEPLFGLDIVTYPDGSLSKEYNPLYLLYILCILFGLLYYFMYSHKYSWISKLVIGFSLGMSGGLGFKGFFNEWTPQLVSSFRPLIVFDCLAPGTCTFNGTQTIENILFVFILLTVMYYFFFSFRRESKVSQQVSMVARLLMMVCFGAFFGSTVMARMALLVERLQFLITDWWSAIRTLV